jgi:hypothetical protein
MIRKNQTLHLVKKPKITTTLALCFSLSLSITLNADTHSIWSDSTAKTDEQVKFSKTITVSGNIKEDPLAVACNIGATVCINGQKVFVNKDWKYPSFVPVKKFIIKGMNEIIVDAIDVNGIAGLVAKFFINKKLVAQTDSSWKVPLDEKLKPAVQVFQYGSDPWGQTLNNPIKGPKNHRKSIDGQDITVTDGFKVERLYSVPKETEKSWVGLTEDDAGRFVTCDQNGGFYRVILKDGGKSENQRFSQPEPIALFDGKSLDGWEYDPSLWSVQDGVIVCDTFNKKIKRNSFLVWKGEVADFELSYDAKIEGKNNSGMMYRAQYSNKETFSLIGNQCDCHPRAEYCGMLYSEGTGRKIVAKSGTKAIVDKGNGKPRVVGKTEPIAPVDISEWHTYKIVVKGNRLKHYVNGRLAVDVTDNHKNIRLKGLLGLQCHAGRPMKGSFRNIVLTKF